MLPKYIIIGSMKCGTSSLFRYLRSHPDLISSYTKETDFFLTPENFAKGLDFYQSYFKGEGLHTFEASPNYTKRQTFPGVPERMHSVVPNAKLIYVMRDPVKRIVSNYLHQYATRDENRSFSESIRSPDSNYIQISRYFYQLEAFLEYYPKEKIHLVQSEELNQHPEKILREVCAFMEIPFSIDPEILGIRYHDSAQKVRISQLQVTLSEKTSSRRLKRFIRKSTRFLGKPMETPIPTEAEIEFIREILQPDIDQMREFSGMGLSGWPF